MGKNLRFGAMVFALASVTFGCSGADVASEQELYDATEEELFVLGARIWRQTSIPVCWENPSVSNATERGWVKDAITNTWAGSVTRARFTGWGTCPASSSGIRIRIEDTGPHVKALGRNLNGVAQGMVLNFTFANWGVDCAAAGEREACIRSIAVHEFGHAMGFAHEQNRPDKPATCLDAPQGPNGDTLAGPYDANSIMNYCNSRWNNDGRLSTNDIKYSRMYYGNPGETTSRRDAVNWGNGKIYHFNKGEYTRYDVTLDRADSGYPLPIIGNWRGWPAAWTGGIDAVVNLGNGQAYFFRGSEYLRFNITTDQVDQAPRAMVGNLANWPATFTQVDAAVRWNNGKVYLFRGTQYARLDIATNRIDQQPLAISGNWPGLYTSDINYAFEKGTKAYFFRGTEYVRYDMPADATDAGYPLPIVGYWPGFAF